MPNELVPLSKIARRYPGARGAAASHPATWTRWILKGALGSDGNRHKLAATRFGSRWLVTESAVDAFFAALGTLPVERTVATAKPLEQSRSAQAAARELEAAGA